MTQLETLATQGLPGLNHGLASLDTERLKRMRSHQMRLCFSHINDQRYRMEFVARVRGMEFYNDAASRSINATWYGLKGLEGRLIWIVNSIDSVKDYARILPVVREKVEMMICVGPHSEELHTLFAPVVTNIVDASSLHEAVHTAYCTRMEHTKVVFSPACPTGNPYEQEGSAFTREVNEL